MAKAKSKTSKKKKRAKIPLFNFDIDDLLQDESTIDKSVESDSGIKIPEYLNPKSRPFYKNIIFNPFFIPNFPSKATGLELTYGPQPGPQPVDEAAPVNITINFELSQLRFFVVGGSMGGEAVFTWSVTGAPNLTVNVQVKAPISYPNWTTIITSKEPVDVGQWAVRANPGERLSFRAIVKDSKGNKAYGGIIIMNPQHKGPIKKKTSTYLTGAKIVYPKPKPKGKQCKNCNTLNPLNAKFCFNCGKQKW